MKDTNALDTHLNIIEKNVIKELLETAYTSYITDSDGSYISMQSLDLGTQIYEEMLRKKMRFVCSTEKEDDKRKMLICIKYTQT